MNGRPAGPVPDLGRIGTAPPPRFPLGAIGDATVHPVAAD